VDTWTASDLIEDDEDCMEMDGFAGKVSKNVGWYSRAAIHSVAAGGGQHAQADEVQELQQAHVSGVQLGLVLTTITPFSTGAAAHQRVCEALDSALKAAAEGKVTSPAALDVPALAAAAGQGWG
jgi:hypothetical protein